MAYELLAHGSDYVIASVTGSSRVRCMYETLNLLHAIEIKVLQGVKESTFGSYYCVLVKNNMRERERERERESSFSGRD